MGDVKTDALPGILNRMESTYAGSTIRQTYITMGTMFQICCDERYYHQTSDEWHSAKPVRAVD